MQLGATAITGTTEALGASSSWTFEVTERDIRRFLQAIGDSSPDPDPDPDPDPQGQNRPFGTRPALTAPPLFFQVMAWQDVAPELLPPDGAPVEIQGGPSQARSMGGASDFTVVRQVHAGERIRVCSTLTGVESRQGRQGPLHLISRQTTFTDEAGQQVACERATYLRRAV
jgi:hypothetical protein